MTDIKATSVSPQDVVKQAQGALGQALNAIATLSEQGLTGLEGVQGEIQKGQATLDGLSTRLDDHDKQFNSMQKDINHIKRLVEGKNIEVDLNGQEYSVDIGEVEPSNIEVHYQIGGKHYVAQMEKNNLTGPFLNNSNIKDQKANLHFSEALEKLEIKSKGGGIFGEVVEEIKAIRDEIAKEHEEMAATNEKSLSEFKINYLSKLEAKVSKLEKKLSKTSKLLHDASLKMSDTFGGVHAVFKPGEEDGS